MEDCSIDEHVVDHHGAIAVGDRLLYTHGWIKVAKCSYEQSILTAFIPAKLQSYTILSLNNAGLKQLRITEQIRAPLTVLGLRLGRFHMI